MNILAEHTMSIKQYSQVRERCMQKSTDRLLDNKRIAVQEIFDKWSCKFPLMFDELMYKEKDLLMSFMCKDFIMQRSAKHIAKLACKIRHSRSRLAINSVASYAKDRVEFQLVPAIVEFSTGSKATLGILAHANMQNQYELFQKSHILNVIQKAFPDIQTVSDSVYEMRLPRSTIQTVYFEICKHSGRHFSLEETKQLRECLQKELPYSIEKVSPILVMTRNNEEFFKSILALDREIHRVSDPPQVMILLDQQTLSTVDLTVLLVYAQKEGDPNLKETLMRCISNAEEQVELEIDRWETVRYLKKHSVTAGIIKMRFDKQMFPRRKDGGLYFHLVRQKASRMLTAAIGPFRDYNGGLLIKQMELFEALVEEFPTIPQDMLESFYYSLRPLEAQIMLSIKVLRAFFESFLEAMEADLKQPTDSFVRTSSIHNHLIFSIRTLNKNFNLDPSMFTAQDLGNLISCTIHDKNSCFCGYLVANGDAETADRLQQAVDHELNKWNKKFENRQVLRLNLLNPVISFDPRIGGDKSSSTVLKLLFEGLMRFGKTGALEYGVAKEVSISPDKKTYIFTLKNTYWSNGMPVTAKDFEYAWKTALSPDFKAPFAYLFYPIKNSRRAKAGSVHIDEVGIRAIGNTTLAVELEFPAPYFLESTALTVYSPVFHELDQQYPHWSQHEGTGYICNGAFCLASNNLNEQHIFTKNPLYWDSPSISLDEIIALRSDVQAPFEMFRHDLVDWAGVHIKTRDSGKMFLEEETEIGITENTGTCWLVFNTTQAPFDNKELRQALAMGINRSKLQERFRVLPAISPVPKIHSQLTESSLSSYSEEKARERFDEALKKCNLDRKDFPPIQIIHTRKHPHPQFMEFIKEEWERIFGIRCALKPLTWDILFSELSGNEFQVGSVVWEPWINDPIYTLNAFVEGGRNLPKWIHDRYRQIVYEAEKEFNLEKRMALYAQAEQILLEEMPIAPLFSTSFFALKKKNMKIDCPLNRLDFKWCHFI